MTLLIGLGGIIYLFYQLNTRHIPEQLYLPKALHTLCKLLPDK